MVKKQKIKKIVEEISAWGENLAFPKDPERLNLEWNDLVNGILIRENIPQPLPEKDMARIRGATIDLMQEANLEAIKAHLDHLIDQEVLEFTVKLAGSDSLDRYLSVISLSFPESCQNISNSHKKYFENSNFKIDLQPLIRELEGKFITNCKTTKPNYYQIIQTAFNLKISEIELQLAVQIQQYLGFTLKEQYNHLLLLIESTQAELATFASIEFTNFPSILLTIHTLTLKNYALEHWMRLRDQESTEMLKNFSVFLSTILDKLQSHELEAFDKSLCSDTTRLALAKLALSQFPGCLSLPSMIADSLLNALNVPGGELIMAHLRVATGLDDFVEDFLLNTDQVSRFFSIISLVLILSDTYRFFTEACMSNHERYFAYNREWLRRIIFVAFERKYEQMLDIQASFTEWSLVLVVEQHVADRVPMWQAGEDVISMTDYIRTTYDKQNKRLGDKIADLSAKPERNAFYKSALKLTSKIVKSITPSKHIKEFSLELIKNTQSLTTTILVSGWLSQEDNLHDSWGNITKNQLQGTTYALRWDSGSKEKLIKNEMLSTIFNTVGLIVGGPVVKLAHLALLLSSNPFKKRARKAEATGYVLADLIASHKLGNASISLVGFSLGTRVIYFCLQKLRKMGCSVHDVVLLGGAAPCDHKTWRECKDVVAGRMINAYSKTDKILSKLYSLSRLEKAIGNFPLEILGAENFDVTDIATGHLKYREVLDLILDRIGYYTR